MAWDIQNWWVGRWAVRAAACPLMKLAVLGMRTGESLVRVLLWLGADPRGLADLPPDVRERVLRSRT